MTKALPRAVVSLLVAARLAAGQADTTGPKTFYTPHDGVVAAAFLGGSVALSLFDARIAKNFKDTTYFHVRIGDKLDNIFTHINETTLTVGGLAVYTVARLTKQKTVADVAFHVAESVAAASLSAQVIRGPLGRTRPQNTDPPFDNQYDFHFFKGFTHFAQRAFPSIHSSSGFAAAAALTEEVHERAPGATWWVAVPAYIMGATPGLSRMYLGQHWASDIFSGAFLGVFYGQRVVSYSHKHPTTPVDRLFLGKAPQLQFSPGAASMSWSFTF